MGVPSGFSMKGPRGLTMKVSSNALVDFFTLNTLPSSSASCSLGVKRIFVTQSSRRVGGGGGDDEGVLERLGGFLHVEHLAEQLSQLLVGVEEDFRHPRLKEVRCSRGEGSHSSPLGGHSGNATGPLVVANDAEHDPPLPCGEGGCGSDGLEVVIQHIYDVGNCVGVDYASDFHDPPLRHVVGYVVGSDLEECTSVGAQLSCLGGPGCGRVEVAGTDQQ